MLTFDFVGNAVTIYKRTWVGNNATGHWGTRSTSRIWSTPRAP